jgi:hypothetical protein
MANHTMVPVSQRDRLPSAKSLFGSKKVKQATEPVEVQNVEDDWICEINLPKGVEKLKKELFLIKF